MLTKIVNSIAVLALMLLALFGRTLDPEVIKSKSIGRISINAIQFSGDRPVSNLHIVLKDGEELVIPAPFDNVPSPKSEVCVVVFSGIIFGSERAQIEPRDHCDKLE